MSIPQSPALYILLPLLLLCTFLQLHLDLHLHLHLFFFFVCTASWPSRCHQFNVLYMFGPKTFYRTFEETCPSHQTSQSQFKFAHNVPVVAGQNVPAAIPANNVVAPAGAVVVNTSVPVELGVVALPLEVKFVFFHFRLIKM